MKWLSTYMLILLSFTLNAETIYSDLIGGTTNNSGGAWDETDIAIDISLHTAITIDIDYGEIGDQEKFDKFEIHYRLDFGAWVKPVKLKNDMAGDATLSITALEGNDLEIKIRMLNDDDAETWWWDNLVVTGTSTLPIELLYFNAIEDDSAIMFSWATASETNNDYFIIQESSDGVNFSNIEFIEGAGNNSSMIEYNIMSNRYSTGNYYKLKQVDFNGTFSYSNIIYVTYVSQTVPVEVCRYDLNGKIVDHTYKGITIIKYSNGSIKKIKRTF